MRISVTRVSWLLPVLALMPLVQGCDQKAPKQVQAQTLAPPIVDTPPPKPATVSTADLPPPVVTPPTPPATTADATPEPPPKKPVHHPKKPAETPAQSAQETASATPSATSGVSAIGEFSSGASGDQKTKTDEMIGNTEKGLNSINRQLSDSEKKTDAQIREFLKQAKDALNTGDVDGAQSLVNKAKVLLEELKQ